MYTKSELIDVYAEVNDCNFETAQKEVEYILNGYSEYINCESDVQKKREIVLPHKFFTTDKKYCSAHRLDFPLTLSMVLTYKCECYCKYCFVNANKKASKCKLLETEKIMQLIDEAADYGVFGINITGGDPFTRSDIFDIVSKCINRKLNINISTKVLLSDEKIVKLVDTGLDKIQFSLDSDSDEEEKYLIGVDGFATKMLTVIKKVIDAGITVYVNTVVTKRNIASIPNLVEKLEKIGVTKHYITPYLRTLGRHDDDLFPSKEEYAKLTMFVKSYTGNMYVNYKEPNLDENIENEQNRCTGGRMGLVITPSGKVGICERLIDFEETIVGDVKEQNLREIWKGEKLYNLIEPSRDMFNFNECQRCERYDECVLNKGLCYARCKIAHGNIFRQDPLCPLKNATIRFV